MHIQERCQRIRTTISLTSPYSSHNIPSSNSSTKSSLWAWEWSTCRPESRSFAGAVHLKWLVRNAIVYQRAQMLTLGTSLAQFRLAVPVPDRPLGKRTTSGIVIPALSNSSTLVSDECKSWRRILRKAALLQDSLLAKWDIISNLKFET